jgi:hypothetical protein
MNSRRFQSSKRMSGLDCPAPTRDAIREHVAVPSPSSDSDKAIDNFSIAIQTIPKR